MLLHDARTGKKAALLHDYAYSHKRYSSAWALIDVDSGKVEWSLQEKDTQSLSATDLMPVPPPPVTGNQQVAFVNRSCQRVDIVQWELQ